MAEETEILVSEEEPGKQEQEEKELKETSKKDGPPVGSERWNQIYWEAQEGKRARQEVDQLRKQMESMQTWNKDLADSISKLGDVLDTKTETDNKTNLENRLLYLKELKTKAKESGDHALDADIDEKIIEVKLAMKEQGKPKAADKKEAKATKEEKPSTPVEDMDSVEKAVYQAWIDENDWFKSNPKLRSMAITAELAIREDPDFRYATTTEILEEVKARVMEKVKPEGKAKQSIANMVESADSGSIHKTSSSVKLSKEEMELAKGFGLTAEEVGRQKLIIMKQRGEGKIR